MAEDKRSIAYWFITGFLSISIILMLAGQTMAIFNYELTVSFGLQESINQVGPLGVQVNRAFGVSDTAIYIPLMFISVVGLTLRKRWSLLTTAAVSGISSYWTITVASILLFAPGTPEYNYMPGPGIVLFVSIYLAFGLWCLVYLILRGDKLISQTGSA